MEPWDLPDDLERCPTCGRFVEADGGYGDLPPGGHFAHDYITVYCDSDCAERKPEPCIHEPATPEEWAALPALEAARLTRAPEPHEPPALKERHR